MRVFILSLLAVSSVHSHAINYPYYRQLLTFTPARGEFPVYNEVTQGYLRYHDSNGAERLLSYSYPEPVYGIRRYSYSSGSESNPFLRNSAELSDTGFGPQSYYQLQESDELVKAREAHFRRWCEQRYQALKAAIDKLRSEGLKPSSDMIAQIQPLEKIISAGTYTGLQETPEMKRIREEHLRIWNEARLKVLQQEAQHLRLQKGQAEANVNAALLTKTTDRIGEQNGFPGETADQKKAREEHLRIYSEQILRVRQLEAERLRKITQTTDKEGGYQQIMQQSPQDIKIELKTNLPGAQGQLPQQQPAATIEEVQPTQVQDTPEVIRAREEHLRLVNEAKFRAQAEGSFNEKNDASYKPVNQEGAIKSIEKIDMSPLLKFVPAVQQPIQPIQNIAILQTSQPTQQGAQQLSSSLKTDIKSNLFGQQQQPAQVQDTPEVIRAREEHLKLFNEIKLKAIQGEQRIKEIATRIDTYSGPGIVKDDEKMSEAERLREEERLNEIERLREAERVREEEQMRVMERLREIEREKEEEHMLEAERLRLKEEDERRLEKERLDEANRVRQEEQLRLQEQQKGSSSSSKINDPSNAQIKTVQQTIASQDGQISGTSGDSFSGIGLEYKGNPYLFRFAAQPGTTGYILGEHQLKEASLSQSLSNPNIYYLPSSGTGSGGNYVFKSQNPFLIRYSENSPLKFAGEQQIASASITADSQKSKLKNFEKYSTYGSSSSSLGFGGGSPTSLPNIKINYGTSTDAADLSALEKATREHFRAHELALENLRLANLKNPFNKDC